MASAAFGGFSPKFVQFLKGLKKNNDRAWFQAHKADYEEHVQSPFLEFVAALQAEFDRFAPHVVADDRKVGGSMMRINRDTRFSKDKSPYKDYVAARFRHEVGKDRDAPGFYLGVTTKDVTLGTGVWHPEPPALQAIREKIAADPNAWFEVSDAKAFTNVWNTAYGESLKRPPKGFDADHPAIDDLKRKDFVVLCTMKHADFTARDFTKRAAKAWAASNRFQAYLADALGVSW